MDNELTAWTSHLSYSLEYFENTSYIWKSNNIVIFNDNDFSKTSVFLAIEPLG